MLPTKTKHRFQYIVSKLIPTQLISKSLLMLKKRKSLTSDQHNPWLLSSAFAHRGLFDAKQQSLLPENSLSAFQRAIDFNYGIELDVHWSSDGIPMVFHDETLERMTALQGSIRERSSEVLKKTQLLDSDQYIPSLAEVFELVKGQVPILVEIKNNGHAVGPLEEAVALLCLSYQSKYPQAKLAIQSFNPLTLIYFAKYYPMLTRGLLTYDFPDKGKLNIIQLLLLKKMLFYPLCKPNYIAYEVNALMKPWPLLLKRSKKYKLPLLTWTVRTESEFQIAKKCSDQVIFENWTDPSDVKKELEALIASRRKM
jgi:glycerophosphoryl diester phosphodiesterase